MTSNVGRMPLGKRIANADLGSVMIGATLLVFMASVFFSGIMPKSNTVQLVTIAAVDFLAALRLIRKNNRVKLRSPGVFALIFLVYVLINQSGLLINGADSYWLTRFALCFVAAILLAVDSPKWLGFFVKALATLALVHAVATIAFLVFPNIYTSWFKPRFYPSTITATGYKSGLCNHYSTNGMYLAWGLIASFFLWQTFGRRGVNGWRIVGIVIFAALLLTTKRAHLVFGIGSCLVIYVLLNVGKGSLGTAFKLVAFLIAALAVFYIASLFISEITGVVDRLIGVELDEGRSDYYKICLELFGSSPLVGHGWESFTTALYQSGVADLARLFRNGNLHQNAHNVYLQLLAEEGLVGLFLFLLLAMTSLVHSIKASLSTSQSVAGRLSVFSLAVQVFFLLYCITGNPLYDVAEYSVYLMVGVAPFLVQRSFSDSKQTLD